MYWFNGKLDLKKGLIERRILKNFMKRWILKNFSWNDEIKIWSFQQQCDDIQILLYYREHNVLA